MPPLGATIAVAREQDRFAVSAAGIFAGRASGATRNARDRFRHRRRALPRHAVSVGRQDQLRTRLLRAGAGRAECLRHPLPARQRHAGKRIWHDGRSEIACGAAISCSGRAMSPSSAMRPRSCTPTPSIWRSRSSRSPRRSRGSARAAITSPACGGRPDAQHCALPQARTDLTIFSIASRPGYPMIATS